MVKFHTPNIHATFIALFGLYTVACMHKKSKSNDFADQAEEACLLFLQALLEVHSSKVIESDPHDCKVRTRATDSVKVLNRQLAEADAKNDVRNAYASCY